MWFKNGLKAQKLQKQHALKGQKLLAQGIALGNYGRKLVALKEQKLYNSRKNIKLLPFQGALLIAIIPRALPWARSFCPFRACCFWSFWAART